MFRGAFTLENGVYKGTSLKSKDNNGNVVINNPITLNSCIDFDNGTVSIYYEGTGAGRKVCVDFDGDLWTSTSRTSIWSGVAALTELKNGTDYGLVPYNMNGERLAFSGERRANHLIWPFGLRLARTIAGMVFKRLTVPWASCTTQQGVPTRPAATSWAISSPSPPAWT